MSELKNAIQDIIEETTREQVQSLVQYVKYELDVLNAEVAMNSKRHGYNYKTIAMPLINSVQAIKTGNNYIIEITDNGINEQDDKTIELINLGLNNALIRFGADGGE